MTRIVEIRTYALRPGAVREYERLMGVAVPLLARWDIDVVAFGPSVGDPTGYYLIRAFDSLDHRQRSEDAFYRSAEWREGPRGPVLALIESYIDLVLELDEPTIDGLRRAARKARMDDPAS
jgi:hypothetical protein